MSTKIHDLTSQALTSLTLHQSVTTTSTGVSGDFLSGDGLISMILLVGAVSGTGSPALTVTAQESTDGTTWTAWQGVNGSKVSAVTQTTVFALSSFRTARYQRAITPLPAGNTPSFDISVVFLEQVKQL